ncbi:hypothetical protein [Nocardia nova]|uniref:hypothetical protein n=1 Tax=Nocardia nova TaxID=37330 RepID=UPI001E313AAB|nr:hypothetical protein [Nocardia nova]
MTETAQLTAADELLIHQHHDTFASVSTSDPAWSERVYLRGTDLTGDVAVAFGLGRYLNRNVMDAYGLVSIGKAQYNVRASRRLFPDPHTTIVGPLRYEVVEPLVTVRIILEPNDAQPVTFDLRFVGTTEPSPEHHLIRRGYRRAEDVTRYIQVGAVDGQVTVHGKQYLLDANASFGIRDHSWGTRTNVGPPATDEKESSGIAPGSRFRMIWAPGRLDTVAGTTALHFAHWDAESNRGRQDENTTSILDPKLGRIHATNVEWRPRFHKSGAVEVVHFECNFADGSRRRFRIEPVGDTASCLGPGLYNGYRGHYHGENRGSLHIEGDTIADVTVPEIQPDIHQLREHVARIVDEDTGDTGWGGLQIEMVGKFPEFGLPMRNYR